MALDLDLEIRIAGLESLLDRVEDFSTEDWVEIFDAVKYLRSLRED
jgi:hypothetical protein